jgi:DnaA-homolog protein
MISQLGLPLSIRDDARFNNFLAPPGSVRAQAIQYLQDFGPDSSLVFLWGAGGAGLNHLLLASCNKHKSQGRSVQYLPLIDVVSFDPSDVLNGLEELDLLCLHRLDAIAEKTDWQEAIFHLYNRMMANGRKLIVSADAPPVQLGFSLADLTSRLCQGVIFHLPPYSDNEKIEIVRYRGKCVGLEISEECARYIINRDSRALSDLMTRLVELDKASLQAQRRITIPFVKGLFNW